MTAWISYARASTDEQTTSCTQQHAENERAAGAPPTATFDDEGVRGSVPVEDRVGFTRMLEFLKTAKVGTFTVRLYDTSRLGRFLDPEEHFVAERDLRRSGARAVVYTKGSYTPGRSIANSVLKAVESHANRAYSEKLSRDVHRGKMAALRQGRRSGGFAPHGYDLEYLDHEGKPYVRVRFVPVGGGRRAFAKHVTYGDGRAEVIGPEHRFRPKTERVHSRLVPGDPQRIEAVRYIYDAYLKGEGMRSIAHALEARALPSPEGNGWCVPGVRSILMNPAYTGRSVYGRRSESKYHRLEPGGLVRELADGEHAQKIQLHIEDESRWVIVEGAHEPLIPLATWREANERRVRMADDRMAEAGRATARHPYLLSGLLVCPLCGRAYTGARAKNSRGYTTPYYTCGTYARGGGCARGGIREDEADELIIGFVEDQLRLKAPPERLRDHLRAAFEEIAGPVPAPVRKAPSDDIAAVEREIASIVANVSPENLALFDARLTKLRERRDTLRRSAERMRTEAPEPPRLDVGEAVESAFARATRFRELLRSTDPNNVAIVRQEILPVFVHRILVKAAEGVLDVEGYTDEELAAAGRPPYVASSHVYRGSGRAKPSWGLSATGARRQAVQDTGVGAPVHTSSSVSGAAVLRWRLFRKGAKRGD